MNKNSKIYKEFSAIIQGNSKLSFITYDGEGIEGLTSSLKDVRVPLIKQRKHKFNKHFMDFEVFSQLTTPVEVKEAVTIKPRSISRSRVNVNA